MEINTRAKINLTLDVTGKLENGYHSVEMIMQQISLCDTLTLKKSEKDILITSDSEKIPLDERNIVYKAANLFLEESGIDCGLKIHIEKRIPVCAGLAGGSTNAAGTLIALNDMFNTGYTTERLMSMGVKLGADVPFCITGGTALARGIGDKLSKIEGMNRSMILLVKPNVSVSTKWVYQNFDIKNVNHIDTDAVVKSIECGRIDYKKLGNVLESVTAKKHAVINDIKKEMINLGAVFSMMSGSGPTVFGIFEDELKLSAAYNNFIKNYDEVFITYTV